MSKKPDVEVARLDEAARAGWLYYFAGNTQDEIARKLGVSRQTAQRLVSLSVSERLIKVRLDHPIARCLDLSQRLRDLYGLLQCEVVPADPDATSTTLGIAEAGAAEIERRFSSQHPIVAAIGSGRTLRAVIGQLPAMDCPQHKVVSLVGSITPDGAASFYDVVMRMSDAIRAPHYPLPLPVIAATVHERSVFLSQKSVANVIELGRLADVHIVGIGQLGEAAPLLLDGFLTHDEMRALLKAGAVGEMLGWAFDAEGQLIEGLTNDRVTSIPLKQSPDRPVIGVAMGSAKTVAIRAALSGRLVNGLITNETMAEQLLQGSAPRTRTNII